MNMYNTWINVEWCASYATIVYYLFSYAQWFRFKEKKKKINKWVSCAKQTIYMIIVEHVKDVVFAVSFFSHSISFFFCVLTVVSCVRERRLRCAVWYDCVRMHENSLQLSRISAYSWCFGIVIRYRQHWVFTIRAGWANWSWHCQWNKPCKQSLFSFQSIVNRWMIKT